MGKKKVQLEGMTTKILQRSANQDAEHYEKGK